MIYEKTIVLSFSSFEDSDYFDIVAQLYFVGKIGLLLNVDYMF
jgi:hypothetical protein